MKSVQDKVDRWKRRKMIYDRRQRGETRVAIARDLGISPPRVKQLEDGWIRLLKGVAIGTVYSTTLYRAVCDVPNVSPEYGYA